jgi:hypothetical protein
MHFGGKEQYQHFLEYVLDDPENIGMTIFFLQDPRPEPKPGIVVFAYAVFLKEDDTKKPSYSVLTDF